MLSHPRLAFLTLCLLAASPLFSRADPPPAAKDVAKETLRLTHPTRLVRAVDFAPDGECVASAASDGFVRLWDVRTGRERRHMQGSNGPVLAVCFSPDGRCLASAGDDSVIHLWDPATGKEVHHITGHNAPVAALCFAPDGKSLASASHDGTARVWSVPGGAEAFVAADVNVPQRLVSALCFTNDGRGLALGTLSGDIELWRTVPGRRPDWAQQSAGKTFAFALSPDGKTLASTNAADPYEVVFREITTGQVRTFFGRETPTLRVLFAADGRSLFEGRMDGEVWVRSAGGRESHIGSHDGRGNGGRVTGLALSPDGRTLASAALDGTVRLWDVTTAIPDDSPAAVTADQAETLFKDLHAADAETAYRALQDLRRAPDRALPLLRRLKPVRSEEFRRIDRLVAELDDDHFAIRERATAELGRLGATAEPALSAALPTAPSLEARRRITELLQHVSAPLVPSPEEVFHIRCIELLEAIGTPDARAVLKDLASGVDRARITSEARAALTRLAHRPH